MPPPHSPVPPSFSPPLLSSPPPPGSCHLAATLSVSDNSVLPPLFLDGSLHPSLMYVRSRNRYTMQCFHVHLAILPFLPSLALCCECERETKEERRCRFVRERFLWSRYMSHRVTPISPNRTKRWLLFCINSKQRVSLRGFPYFCAHTIPPTYVQQHPFFYKVFPALVSFPPWIN